MNDKIQKNKKNNLKNWKNRIKKIEYKSILYIKKWKKLAGFAPIGIISYNITYIIFQFISHLNQIFIELNRNIITNIKNLKYKNSPDILVVVVFYKVSGVVGFSVSG